MSSPCDASVEGSVTTVLGSAHPKRNSARDSVGNIPTARNEAPLFICTTVPSLSANDACGTRLASAPRINTLPSLRMGTLKTADLVEEGVTIKVAPLSMMRLLLIDASESRRVFASTEVVEPLRRATLALFSSRSWEPSSMIKCTVFDSNVHVLNTCNAAAGPGGEKVCKRSSE